MKTTFGIMAVMILSIFTACNKTTGDITPSVEGTYIGTLSKTTELKSSTMDNDATMYVSLMDSASVEIH